MRGDDGGELRGDDAPLLQRIGESFGEMVG
jgi:hypothetical protein